jgi:hypothetical protein
VLALADGWWVAGILAATIGVTVLTIIFGAGKGED